MDLGAVVEHGLVQYDDRTTFFQWQVDTMLSFIDAVGVDNTIIGSDLGQKNNPFPIDSYERVLGQLLRRVLDTDSRQAYRCHMSKNPADDGPVPEETERDSGSLAEPLSTKVDPDFIPDTDHSTPEEKATREKPEETGS